VVAFTIEADQTRKGQAVEGKDPEDEYVVRKPIRGLLTNHGYMIPDPETPNRWSIWFSGGALEVHEESDLGEWKKLFNEDELPRRDIGEYARVLAAKFLLGATSNETMAKDGAMSYKLKRPIGGHGQVFCDVLYSDEDFRVVRGHHGTTYVHSRVPTIRSSS
jgi:hypothetical protein